MDTKSRREVFRGLVSPGRSHALPGRPGEEEKERRREGEKERREELPGRPGEEEEELEKRRERRREGEKERRRVEKSCQVG